MKKIKKVKAWATITKRGVIALVAEDGWNFYFGVFDNKRQANKIAEKTYRKSLKVVPITITYNA